MKRRVAVIIEGKPWMTLEKTVELRSVCQPEEGLHLPNEFLHLPRMQVSPALFSACDCSY